MDYRNIFAVAAVIFASGYFVRSFQSAYAFPQGPNVSLGSNPISSFTGMCDSNTSNQLMSTGNDVFIITDVVVGDGSYSYNADLQINGSAFVTFAENSSQSYSTGFMVGSNSTVSCFSHYSKRITINGYYAQP